jgi:hypothetical protein
MVTLSVVKVRGVPAKKPMRLEEQTPPQNHILSKRIGYPD